MAAAGVDPDPVNNVCVVGNIDILPPVGRMDIAQTFMLKSGVEVRVLCYQESCICAIETGEALPRPPVMRDDLFQEVPVLLIDINLDSP